MFQEAAATALDVKQAVPGARYYLLCEWLDMTPISTITTAIDEIIVLRKQKRLSSSIRREYSTAKGRRRSRSSYVDYSTQYPLSPDMFMRFLEHVAILLNSKQSDEETALQRGYF